MAIKFTHTESLHTFIIINGYLPQDNSVWGRDVTAFMSYLLGPIDLYAMFLVGDVNSRLGMKLDYIEGCWMKPLINMGMYFLIFVLESDKCVHNG